MPSTTPLLAAAPCCAPGRGAPPLTLLRCALRRCVAFARSFVCRRRRARARRIERARTRVDSPEGAEVLTNGRGARGARAGGDRRRDRRGGGDDRVLHRVQDTQGTGAERRGGKARTGKEGGRGELERGRRRANKGNEEGAGLGLQRAGWARRARRERYVDHAHSPWLLLRSLAIDTCVRSLVCSPVSRALTSPRLVLCPLPCPLPLVLPPPPSS